jgi:hypothetical protein
MSSQVTRHFLASMTGHAVGPSPLDHGEAHANFGGCTQAEAADGDVNPENNASTPAEDRGPSCFTAVGQRCWSHLSTASGSILRDYDNLVLRTDRPRTLIRNVLFVIGVLVILAAGVWVCIPGPQPAGVSVSILVPDIDLSAFETISSECRSWSEQALGEVADDYNVTWNQGCMPSFWQQSTDSTQRLINTEGASCPCKAHTKGKQPGSNTKGAKTWRINDNFPWHGIIAMCQNASMHRHPFHNFDRAINNPEMADLDMVTDCPEYKANKTGIMFLHRVWEMLLSRRVPRLDMPMQAEDYNYISGHIISEPTNAGLWVDFQRPLRTLQRLMKVELTHDLLVTGRACNLPKDDPGCGPLFQPFVDLYSMAIWMNDSHDYLAETFNWTGNLYLHHDLEFKIVVPVDYASVHSMAMVKCEQWLCTYRGLEEEMHMLKRAIHFMIIFISGRMVLFILLSCFDKVRHWQVHDLVRRAISSLSVPYSEAGQSMRKWWPGWGPRRSGYDGLEMGDQFYQRSMSLHGEPGL